MFAVNCSLNLVLNYWTEASSAAWIHQTLSVGQVTLNDDGAPLHLLARWPLLPAPVELQGCPWGSTQGPRRLSWAHLGMCPFLPMCLALAIPFTVWELKNGLREPYYFSCSHWKFLVTLVFFIIIIPPSGSPEIRHLLTIVCNKCPEAF